MPLGSVRCPKGGNQSFLTIVKISFEFLRPFLISLGDDMVPLSAVSSPDYAPIGAGRETDLFQPFMLSALWAGPERRPRDAKLWRKKKIENKT